MPNEIIGLLRKTVTFKWHDGHESVWNARDLRLRCRCAQCIEEMTGKPLLDPEKVSPNVRAKSMRLVGQYGVSIDWSESPCANIYNFRDLRAQCPCEACRRDRGEAVP